LGCGVVEAAGFCSTIAGWSWTPSGVAWVKAEFIAFGFVVLPGATEAAGAPELA